MPVVGLYFTRLKCFESTSGKDVHDIELQKTIRLRQSGELDTANGNKHKHQITVTVKRTIRQNFRESPEASLYSLSTTISTSVQYLHR